MPTTIIEEDLKSTLTGVTVYPLSVPTDATFPCVAYQQISELPSRYHGGIAMRKIRYQIRCVGKTYTTCLSTASTVIGLLDLNRTNFELATKENEIHVKEAETGVYTAIVDFFVWTTKL